MKRQEIKQIARYEAAGLIETALSDELGIRNLKEVYSLSANDVKVLEEELKRLIETLRK